MKYTYRYSREPTDTISWVCPICLLRKCFPSEVIRSRFNYNININELCCSEKCTEEYERRICSAIAWVRDVKEYTKSVESSHYNNIPSNRRSKYPGVASTLANLGEYFPFNQEKR